MLYQYNLYLIQNIQIASNTYNQLLGHAMSQFIYCVTGSKYLLFVYFLTPHMKVIYEELEVECWRICFVRSVKFLTNLAQKWYKNLTENKMHQ